MHRFIVFAGLALIGTSIPALSKSKEKPPPIEVCEGQVCLTELRWRPAAPSFGSPFPTIEGVLVNGSDLTLNLVDLTFALKSGEELTGSASASFPSSIPPGARWAFSAWLTPLPGMRSYTRSESVRFSGTADRGGEKSWFSHELVFDPLFNPYLRREIKEWEAIHGKRQR